MTLPRVLSVSNALAHINDVHVLGRFLDITPDGEPQRPGALEIGRVEVQRQQLVRLALAPVGRLGEGPGRRGRPAGITPGPVIAPAAAVILATALASAIARFDPGAFPVGSSAAALVRAATRRASRSLPVRPATAATALAVLKYDCSVRTCTLWHIWTSSRMTVIR